MGDPHDDGEMNEMTLPSRHRIRNSSPGSLRQHLLRTIEAVITVYQQQSKSTPRKHPVYYRDRAIWNVTININRHINGLCL